MKHYVFSIYDNVAAAYLIPFFLPNEGMAIRAFSSCINDPKHQFGAHPHDYTLFTIGTFSDENAEILWRTPIPMGNGVEFITPQTKHQPPSQGVDERPVTGRTDKEASIDVEPTQHDGPSILSSTSG